MNARITILLDVAASRTEAGEPDEAPSDAADATIDTSGGFDAEVLVLQQPTMQLATRQRAERGAAVRIDTTDAVWLGEVEECSERDDGFFMHVRLRHVLRDFETLARLAERFGGAAPKGSPVQI